MIVEGRPTDRVGRWYLYSLVLRHWFVTLGVGASTAWTVLHFVT